MKYFLFIFACLIGFSVNPTLARESTDRICMKRGYEIILPYEYAINEIKKLTIDFQKKKNQLKSYKLNFERSFIGIDRYKDAGCSTSRLEEYMTCLVETDGKDCKIYYSQMRLVD